MGCNFTFEDDRALVAFQIILYDYGIYSEIDYETHTIYCDEDVQLENSDLNCIEAIIGILSDDLLLGYSIETYWTMLIDVLEVITLEESIITFSLCIMQELVDSYELFPQENGYYDVYAHYNKICFSDLHENGTSYTAEDIAQKVLKDSDWNGTDKIRLFACNAGTTEAYKIIARILNVPVKAPLGKVVAIPTKHQCWVIPDSWLKDPSDDNELKRLVARLYMTNDAALSSEIQRTLWVESM